MNTQIKRRNFIGPLFFAVTLFLLMGVLVFWIIQKDRESKNRASQASPLELAQGPSENSTVNASGYRGELQKFNLTGFDDSGKRFWNLQGEAAKVDLNQTIFLDENVVLKLEDGTLIKTDHVKWSQKQGTFRTYSPVEVKHGDVEVTGTGAFATPNSNFVQLHRAIRMNVSDGTTLQCDGPVKVYYDQNKMIFYRKVNIKDSRGVLTSDRMDVYFDAENKKVKEMIATGNVVILRDGDTTRSKKAIYNPVDNSIRLEGNPEIMIHKEKVTQ